MCLRSLYQHEMVQYTQLCFDELRQNPRTKTSISTLKLFIWVKTLVRMKTGQSLQQLFPCKEYIKVRNVPGEKHDRTCKNTENTVHFHLVTESKSEISAASHVEMTSNIDK